MKERPIVMTPENAQKCHNAIKTQTRRVVNPQPPYGCEYIINGAYSHALCRSLENPQLWVPPTAKSKDYRLPCPYGAVGDRLWVREAWCVVKKSADENDVLYRGQCEEYPSLKPIWKPSIHMPRWACRTVLEITEVRVERLKDISSADALAEGVTVKPDAEIAARVAGPPETGARMEFFALWESIHGAGSWSQNPWVWVISFRKVGV